MNDIDMAKHLLVGDTIIDLIRNDEDVFYGWQANIAMNFIDEYERNNKKYKNKLDMHFIANQAAKNFLNTLIGK